MTGTAAVQYDVRVTILSRVARALGYAVAISIRRRLRDERWEVGSDRVGRHGRGGLRGTCSGARSGTCRGSGPGTAAVRGHRRAPLRSGRRRAIHLRHGQPRGHRGHPRCGVGHRLRRPRGRPAQLGERGRQELHRWCFRRRTASSGSTPRLIPSVPGRSTSPTRTCPGCTASISIPGRGASTPCSSFTTAPARRSSSSR